MRGSRLFLKMGGGWGGVGEWGRSLGDGSGGQDSRTDKLGCVFRKKKTYLEIVARIEVHVVVKTVLM